MRITTIAAIAVCAATLSACGAALEETTGAEAGAAAATQTAESGSTTGETPAKTPAPKPKPAKSSPSLTVAQENARDAAESYLDLSGFSKKGLVQQLEFEGYEDADIKAALATLKVDWMAEAVESAESYLDMTSFSRQGLIDQLTFEGYTAKQANHAADAVGL